MPAAQGGGEATVIAWIWARTVKCPNPACGCEMPLASSFVLSKKRGKEAWVEPEFDYQRKKITFHVKNGKGTPPEAPKTARGAKFKCIMCGETTLDSYIKQESMSRKMGATLMAVVAEGYNGRIYLSPDEEQCLAARCDKPRDTRYLRVPFDPRNIWCVNYGLDTYDKLFTNRQLTSLTTFSELVSEAQKQAEADAVAAGLPNDHIALSEGRNGCPRLWRSSWRISGVRHRQNDRLPFFHLLVAQFWRKNAKYIWGDRRFQWFGIMQKLIHSVHLQEVKKHVGLGLQLC